MKLSQLMRGIASLPAGQDREVCGITCDSRRIGPGWLFLCIRGTAQDGHRYIPQAVQAGAAVVVTEQGAEVSPESGSALRIEVPAGRAAWSRMCANWFGNPAERLHLIGVTGTNGKTSVTYMLKEVLEACGYKAGLIGTIQNQIGDRVLPSTHTTPDPYDLQSMFALMVAEGCTHAVMEVSSQALDQERVSGCVFDAAVFTNLTQDHLDYHGTIDNYLAAKKKLFAISRRAVVNADDPWTAKLIEGLECPVSTFSSHDDAADYTAKNIRPRGDGVDFELVETGAIGRVRLPIPGLFSVYNALAAAACGRALGLPFPELVAALGRVRGVKGRAEVVPTGRDFSVIIDYAHTPDGLEKICRALKSGIRGRLVTLFGCGGDRDRTKRPRMASAAAALSDFLIVTSDNPRSEDPDAIIRDILPGIPENSAPYTVIPDRAAAIRWAVANAQPGDILLLAGKGHETYQVLKDGVIHFDEREIVADALERVAASPSGDGSGLK